MKVFLSWSGERSKKLAALLSVVIPELIPGIETWMSKRDLAAGDDWKEKILETLKQSNACIACITPENVNSQWIHFEAGAVKGRVEGPVCAVLLGLEPRDLTGPLSQYHAVRSDDEDGILALVRKLNRATIHKRRATDGKLTSRFANLWPEIRDFGNDLICELFRLPDAQKAPYLLGRASALWLENKRDVRGRRAAICELIQQISPLQNETDYLQAAQELVMTNSVWAVCGKKTPRANRHFFDANVKSKRMKNRIERVFFPPATHDEMSSIHQAMRTHFEKKMIVRVFEESTSSHAARSDWFLPVGFGMTLIGQGARDSTDPTSLCAVLIHWGGVGGSAEHYGVILTKPKWTEHFWKVFERIRKATIEVRHKNVREFTKKYPHYAIARAPKKRA